MKKNKKGFTLVELVVVIAVIAILATMSLFAAGKIQASARDSQRLATVRGIQTALERYYGDNGTYIAGNFSQMYAGLVAGGFIVTNTLIDPAGPVTYPGNSNDWTITSRGVNYNYAGAATGYTITLTKEGGGSAVLKNPQ